MISKHLAILMSVIRGLFNYEGHGFYSELTNTLKSTCSDPTFIGHINKYPRLDSA